jgi:hypothetical protein
LAVGRAKKLNGFLEWIAGFVGHIGECPPLAIFEEFLAIHGANVWHVKHSWES